MPNGKRPTCDFASKVISEKGTTIGEPPLGVTIASERSISIPDSISIAPILSCNLLLLISSTAATNVGTKASSV